MCIDSCNKICEINENGRGSKQGRLFNHRTQERSGVNVRDSTPEQLQLVKSYRRPLEVKWNGWKKVSSPAHIIVLHIAVTSVNSLMINMALNIDITSSKWMTLNHILIDHEVIRFNHSKTKQLWLDSPGERWPLNDSEPESSGISESLIALSTNINTIKSK